MPSDTVLSSLDDLHTICIQEQEPTYSMPFLRAAIKLHVHSLTLDKACF